jgi:hypothetical protein
MDAQTKSTHARLNAAPSVELEKLSAQSRAEIAEAFIAIHASLNELESTLTEVAQGFQAPDVDVAWIERVRGVLQGISFINPFPVATINYDDALRGFEIDNLQISGDFSRAWSSIHNQFLQRSRSANDNPDDLEVSEVG